MSLFRCLISAAPILPQPAAFAAGEGAGVEFLGVVRGMEAGRPISGIDYTAYLPMAERTLHELCERGQQEYGPHEVEIQHRLGFVAATDASIFIRVKTKHSAEGFDLCRWYLKEIKTSVPIWKRPVFVEAE